MIPTDVSGLVSWHKGKSLVLGQAIAQWDDASGNGRHRVQSTPGFQPTAQLVDGIPACVFDGIDDDLGGGYPDFGDAYTWFVLCSFFSPPGTNFPGVLEASNGAANTGFNFFGQGSVNSFVTARFIQAAGVQANSSCFYPQFRTMHAFAGRCATSTCGIWDRKVPFNPQSYTAPNANTLTQLSVGSLSRAVSGFLLGAVGELFVYDHNVTDTELFGLMDYLQSLLQQRTSRHRMGALLS